jgi:hypothetical protein
MVPADLLRKLGALHIDLILDLYASPAEGAEAV